MTTYVYSIADRSGVEDHLLLLLGLIGGVNVMVMVEPVASIEFRHLHLMGLKKHYRNTNIFRVFFVSAVMCESCKVI